MKTGRSFTSWQSSCSPSIEKVEHNQFQGRKGTISNGWFFSSWRHECLLSWPVKVLRNQTNSFSPVWVFSFVTDESAAKLDKQLVKRELCFLWQKYPPLKCQSSTFQLILFFTSHFKQSPSSLAVLLARFFSPLINFFLTPITGWEVELNLRLSSTFTSMGATSLHSQVLWPWCAPLCLKHIAFATMFTLILFSLLLLLLPSLRALVLGHHFFFSTSPASAFFSSSNSRQLTPSHSTPLSFLFLS